MRRLNLRLLAILLVSTVVVAGALYGLHELQMARYAPVLLREARAAKERNELTSAIEYYDMYTSLGHRFDADPFDEMGDAQLSLGRYHPAMKSFETALRQDPERADVRKKLVKLSLAAGRVQDARAHLDVLKKSEGTDADLLSLAAKCDIREKRYADAVDNLAKAIAIDPKRIDDAGLMAYVLADRVRNLEDAKDVINKMVKANADNPQAYLMRGNFFLSLARAGVGRKSGSQSDDVTADVAGDVQINSNDGEEQPDLSKPELGNLEQAGQDAQQALTLAPDDESVITFAIRYGLFAKKYRETASLIERAMPLFPKNVYFYTAMSDVARVQRKFDESTVWLEKGLKINPEQVDILWNLANQYIDEGRLADAEKPMKTLRKLDHPKPLMWFLDARKLIVQEQWSEASQELQRVRPALGDWPDVAKQADFFLGGCYEALGRYDLQLIAFRKATSVSSNWLPARMGTARALMMTGKIDEAMEEYRRIALLPGARLDVLVQLTRVQVMLNLRGDKSKRNWEAIRKTLNRIEEVDPKLPAIAVLRAEILVADDEDAKAEELLVKARDNAPETLEYWLALAALADRHAEWSKAEKLLDQVQEKLGDSVMIRLARGRHIVNHEQQKAGPSLKQLEENVSGFSEDEQTALQTGLASYQMAVGDFKESERLCKRVAERQPFNLRVRLSLFEIAYRAEDVAVMNTVLDEVKSIEKSGPLWHYGKAVQFSVRARKEDNRELYNQAMKHLTEAKIKRPNWSRVPLLMAQILDVQGDEQSAISFYNDAIDLGERSPQVISHAVALLYQRRRFNEADRLIRRLQEQQSPFSNEMTRLAAEVSMRLNEAERALELITKAAVDSQDPNEHIWAGRILSALGRNDEAEASFRKAIALDPKLTDAWVALVQHLGRTLQTTKANETLEEAKRYINEEDAPLALAVALESIERLEEAEDKFRKAYEASGRKVPVMRLFVDFLLRQGKLRNAQPFLEEVLKRNSDVSDDERAWARRNLALVLISRGEKGDVQRALELVKVNLDAHPESELENRTYAMIQALSNDKANQVEAAEKLEKILTTHKSIENEGIAEIRFTLARVYLALNDLSKASYHLRILMGQAGKSPRYLTFYVDFLVNKLHEYIDAEPMAEDLMKIAPQQFNSISLMSEIRFQQKRFADISTLCNDYLATPNLDAISKQRRMREISNLLASYGKRLAKEKTPDAKQWAVKFREQSTALYRQNSTERPESEVELAVFLSRQGQHAEAFELVEKNFDKARPEEIAMISSSLMASTVATPEDFSRGEKIVRQALEKNERPVFLVLALADLLNWQDRADEAVVLYQEVLSKQENHPAALNNMALMLALNGKEGNKPLEMVDQAIKVVGPLPMILDTRGTILLQTGNLKEAAADLMKSIEAYPNSSALFHLAQVQIKQGNRAAARDSLTKATDLGLRVEELHPRERPQFRQMTKEFQNEN